MTSKGRRRSFVNRALEIVSQVLKHPVFGIALTLFLAAMAAAGFNTLALARLLLVCLFLTTACAVVAIRTIEISVIAKVAIVIAVLLGCVLLDQLLHAHAAAEKRAKRLCRKGLSGRGLADSRGLLRPDWSLHVDPDHPSAS